MTVLLKVRLSRFDNTLAFQILEQSREFFRRCAGQHTGGSQREFGLRTEKGTVNIDDGESCIYEQTVIYLRGWNQTSGTYYKVHTRMYTSAAHAAERLNGFVYVFESMAALESGLAFKREEDFLTLYRT